MSVKITVTNSGVSLDPVVEYLPNSNTSIVEEKLSNAFGAGILKQGKFGVATDTLPEGDYNYNVTVPRVATSNTATGGYGILNSPRLLNSDCVFVLVGVIVESYGKTTRSSVDPGMYPLGTAFAIKTNACVHLLTAYHTIEQNSKCTKWYVTSKVSRNANGTWNWNANELISVKLLDFDKGNDVALLCSDKVFPKDGLITICRQNEITKVADECLFKTYYCPLDDIISQPSFPPLAASPSENKKMYAISDSHMWLYGGLCGGSSGGVVVNRAGAAVGMHVASDSQALSVQDVKNNDAQEGKCLRRDDDSVYSESSYSCANSHSSVQVIVLLPNIDLLRSLF